MACSSWRRGEAVVVNRPDSYAKYTVLHRMKLKIKEVKELP